MNDLRNPLDDAKYCQVRYINNLINLYREIACCSLQMPPKPDLLRLKMTIWRCCLCVGVCCISMFVPSSIIVHNILNTPETKIFERVQPSKIFHHQSCCCTILTQNIFLVFYQWSAALKINRKRPQIKLGQLELIKCNYIVQGVPINCNYLHFVLPILCSCSQLL